MNTSKPITESYKMKIINQDTVKYYPLGTIYNEKVNKNLNRECTIVDILRTIDSYGNLVKITYKTAYNLFGQLVYNNDTIAVTIAKGFITIGNTKPNLELKYFTSQFE